MKNLKLYSLLICGSIFLGLAGCQEDSGLSDLQKESFFKYYGGTEIDEGRDLAQLDDGSYVILGTKTRLQQIGDGIQTEPNTDIILIKTDVFGNKIWERIFEGSSQGMDSGFALAVDENNGFVIAGTTTDPRNELDGSDTIVVNRPEIILIKTGAEGNLEWRKQFGKNETDLYGRDVIILDNGDYMIAGIITENGVTESICIQTVGGTAGLGEEIRRGTSNSLPSGAGLGRRGFSIAQALNGTTYLVGNTGHKDYPSGIFATGQELLNLFLVKLEPSGNSITLIDNATFGGAGNDHGYAICATDDGAFIIAGSSAGYNSEGFGEQDFFVIKKEPLDGTGNEAYAYEWTNLYGGADDDIAHSIIPTKDGGYLLAGVTSSFGNNRQQYIVKLDAAGAQQWEKTFGFSSIDDAYKVIQTSDGGYAFVGSANDGAGNSMICLFKLTSTGELN